MMIGIFTDGPNLTAKVAYRVGTAKWLLLIDKDSGKIEAVPDPDAGCFSHRHDCGWCQEVVLLNNNKRQSKFVKRIFSRSLFFPLATLVLYGAVAVPAPEKALFALKNSLNVLLQMIIPIFLIFILMVAINRFLNPATKVAKHLGKGSGVQAMLLSAAAGIVSAGPIYAWYPLLKDLREKGAAHSLIAVFLYNRSVKPFLLPIMIAYFGWLYVVVLTIMTVLASFATGYAINVFPGDTLQRSPADKQST